jgi:P27 family predicted phage terminase small subunit
VLHGERPYRINDREPQPRAVAPDRPRWLSAKAVAEWERVLPELLAMGTAKSSDQAGLAAYCEAVAQLEVLSELVARTGPLLVGRDGLAHKNPAVSQRVTASAEVRLWAREFGLTPAARQPMRVELSAAPPAARLLS